MKLHLAIWVSLLLHAGIIHAQTDHIKSQDVLKNDRLTYSPYNTDTSNKTIMWPGDKGIRLIKEIVPVQAGQRIEFLLAARGINPNNKDIYALLYELNPDVTDLGNLSAGTIVLPRPAQTGGSVATNLTVTVHLDEKLKQNIIGNIGQLSTIEKNDSQRLAKSLGTERFARLQHSIAKLQQISIAIQAQTHMFSNDRLSDIWLETNILLGQCVGGHYTELVIERRDLKTDEANITNLANYVSEEKGGDEVPKNGKYTVKISLKKSDNSLIRSGYRIYYCGSGLEPNGARPIDIIDGTITCRLYPANWSFWAKKTPVSNPYPPDSEKIRLDISANDANVVNLIVKP